MPIDLRERGREGEREGEKTLIGFLSHIPVLDWTHNLDVPYLGIEPATFWFLRQCYNQLSHTGQGKTGCSYLAISTGRRVNFSFIKYFQKYFKKENLYFLEQFYVHSQTERKIQDSLYIPCPHTHRLFFLRFYLFINKRGKGKEKGRETLMCGCLSCAPYWGPGLLPRPVPWLGFQPATLQFAD